jgi:hypothetical protein
LYKSEELPIIVKFQAAVASSAREIVRNPNDENSVKHQQELVEGKENGTEPRMRKIATTGTKTEAINWLAYF